MIAAEISRGRERAFAADDDQTGELMRLPILNHARNRLFVFRGIETGSAKNGAATRKDAVNRGARERLDIVVEQTLVAVTDAQYFDVIRNCAANHRANCRI